MPDHRETEYRRQIEQLAQGDLVTVFCCVIAAIDDEHLMHALEQLGHDDVHSLLLYSNRERNRRVEKEISDKEMDLGLSRPTGPGPHVTAPDA